MDPQLLEVENFTHQQAASQDEPLDKSPHPSITLPHV